MVELFIDGNKVSLKEGQSITFNDYNALFDAAEGKGSYTFDIDIDLKDPDNAKLYKHANRINAVNVPKGRSALLRVDGRNIFSGEETILRIEGDEVKIQILCGNSQVNFANADLSLHDLDLGSYNEIDSGKAILSMYGNVNSFDYVCCPVMTTLDWFPYASGDENKIANLVDKDSVFDNIITMVSGTKIIPQPYIVNVIERVFHALGWMIDFNAIELMDYAKKMIVIHGYETLEVKKMLPNWKVNKFLEEIQKLFNVIFICDDLTKKVSIYNINDYYGNLNSFEEIPDDKIVFQEPITRTLEEEQQYAYNYDDVAYNFPSVHFYNQAKLNDEVLKLVQVLEFDKISDFNNNTYKGEAYYNKPYVFHEAAYDTYWVLTKRSSIGTLYHFERVDFFRNGKSDRYVENETSETTLSIVPAEVFCLDLHPKKGDSYYMMGAGLPYARNADAASTEDESTDTKGLNEWIDGDLPEDVDTSGNCLYVAQYKGVANVLHGNTAKEEYELASYPTCFVTRFISGIIQGAGQNRYGEIYDMLPNFSTVGKKLVMDLSERVKDIYKNNRHIDNKEKFLICYEANGRLDVKKMFLINGRKFACVSNEYTIEKGGMSKIVKGTFLPYD